MNRKHTRIVGVILVGGLGTRLRPLTFQIPKPLLPLFHSSLLHDQCKRLSEVVDEIVLLTCYKPKKLRDYVGKLSLSVPVKVLEEREPLGTGGALWAQREMFQGELLFVLNGDVIQRVDYRELLSFFLERDRAGCLLAKRVGDARRYGLIQIGKGDGIEAFLEKPKVEQPGWINAGVYLFKRELLRQLPEGRSSIEQDAFPLWASCHALSAYRYEGYWIDIGTAESYLQAHFDFIERRWEVSEASAFDGFVLDKERKLVLHESCTVAEGAEVGPYVVLYPGSCLGGGSRVERSVLLNGASVKEASLRNVIAAPGAEVEGEGVQREGILI